MPSGNWLVRQSPASASAIVGLCAGLRDLGSTGRWPVRIWRLAKCSSAGASVGVTAPRCSYAPRIVLAPSALCARVGGEPPPTTGQRPVLPGIRKPALIPAQAGALGSGESVLALQRHWLARFHDQLLETPLAAQLVPDGIQFQLARTHSRTKGGSRCPSRRLYYFG